MFLIMFILGYFICLADVVNQTLAPTASSHWWVFAHGKALFLSTDVYLTPLEGPHCLKWFGN